MPVVWVLLKYKLWFFIAGLPAPWSCFRAFHGAFDLLKNLFRGTSMFRHLIAGSENLQASQLLHYPLQDLWRVYCLLKGWLFCLCYSIDWSTGKMEYGVLKQCGNTSRPHMHMETAVPEPHAYMLSWKSGVFQNCSRDFFQGWKQRDQTGLKQWGKRKVLIF